MSHVSSAVAYMHSLKLMHYDIKLLNILLDETQCNVKLADLNLAVATERSSSNTWDAGTAKYMAPEICKIAACDSICISSFSFVLMPLLRWCPTDKTTPSPATFTRSSVACTFFFSRKKVLG